MLIDAEIGEMNISFLEIFQFGSVLISSESSESFLEHVNFKRIVASHEHVDSEVVLIIVDEMRVINVLRNLIIFLILYLCILVNHSYAPPARGIRRFQNPKLIFIGTFTNYFETIEIAWKQIGGRTKVVGVWMASSHFV